MDILVIISALFLGLFCAFLSASLTSFSHEKMEPIKQERENLSEADLQLTKKIEKILKLKHDDTGESFFIVESALYIVAFVTASYYLFSIDFIWYEVFILLFFLFIIIIFLRTVLWATGIRLAEIISLKMVLILRIIHFIITPFHNLLIKIKEIISGKESEEASRDELNAMFETAHEDGSIETDEYRILKNIMHFSDVLVTDVMTPRTMLFSCHADLTVGDIAEMSEIQMYSRFPIWDGSSIDDGIVGYVISKDILSAALKGKSNKKLRDFTREIYIIPENASLDKALEQFLQRRQHISIVVDEYGGVEGILTMEDVLETILGVEIVDEVDKIVDLREAAKHRRDKRIANYKVERDED